MKCLAGNVGLKPTAAAAFWAAAADAASLAESEECQPLTCTCSRMRARRTGWPTGKKTRGTRLQTLFQSSPDLQPRLEGGAQHAELLGPDSAYLSPRVPSKS